CRELLGPIKAGQMAVDPHIDLLYQVLRALPITDRPIDEVQETPLIPLDDDGERALISVEEARHERGVVQSPQLVPTDKSGLNRLSDRWLSHFSLLKIVRATTVVGRGRPTPVALELLVMQELCRCGAKFARLAKSLCVNGL